MASELAGPDHVCRYTIIDIRNFDEEKLLVVAGLRKLGDSIRTEVRHMPILDDIMDHKVLGPAIRQGLEQGRKEGKEEGKQEGKLEEGLAIMRKQMTKRFGRLPGWAEERLAAMSVAELEDLSLAVLDAKTVAELFDR